jgi:hypothetical protein
MAVRHSMSSIIFVDVANITYSALVQLCAGTHSNPGNGLVTGRRTTTKALSEDIRMRHYESTSFIPAGVRSRALVAALLLSSAGLSQRVAAQDTSAPPPPPESTVDSTRAYEAPSSVWYAQRIRRVLGDGSRVVLTDGTLWEIYLPDRPAVDMWKPGDLLIVRESALMQGDYDYWLKDGRTRKPVSARLLGDVSSRIGDVSSRN